MAQIIYADAGRLALVPCDSPKGACREAQAPRLALAIRNAFARLGARGEARGFLCEGSEYLRVTSFDPFGVTWYRAEVRPSLPSAPSATEE